MYGVHIVFVGVHAVCMRVHVGYICCAQAHTWLSPSRVYARVGGGSLGGGVGGDEGRRLCRGCNVSAHGVDGWSGKGGVGSTRNHSKHIEGVHT